MVLNKMTMHNVNNNLAFRIKPDNFAPVLEVAACYIEVGGKFLILKRTVGKTEGGKWGVPGGKIEKKEGSFEAVCRETFEETQIVLSHEQLSFVGKLYIRKPEIDYIYHMYHYKVDHFPNVVLNDEHVEYRWLSEDEMKVLMLMSCGMEAFYHFKALANKPIFARKPFYFIRHGETDVNSHPSFKRVDYDLPLNNRGRVQAANARKIVEDLPIGSVCFSPLKRAVETKEIVVSSSRLEMEQLEDLRECSADVWTKMVLLEQGNGFFVCDKVERFFATALQGLESALKKTSTPLIVAHGGIHLALCYHLSIEKHSWKIGNCVPVHFQPVGELDWKAEIIV
jgi:8-oxo-dGTP pyrophosphatase MutT (NUDIX family)/broad specificity phosphatase PhoE